MTGLRLPLLLLFTSAWLCRGQTGPATVTDPLDFSGLASMRLPVQSERGFSWTAVQSTATDPYQPGRPITFPDPQFATTLPPARGSAWHGQISTSNTGAPLASGNLPPPATRGILQQSEHYHWFTRDGFQIGGPLGQRADLLVSGTGQWASQTVPHAPAGEDLGSRLLLGNVQGRVQVSKGDQLDVQFSGSRINLSDWGVPAGLEALAGRRMSPSYANPAGFAGLKEADRFDSMRAGWTRQAAGTFEIHYGLTAAHLNTTPTGRADEKSTIDLVSGMTGSTPPLANRAVRTRQELQAVYEPVEFALAGRRHRVVVGAGWERAGIRNRWSGPSNSNLITVNGVPAFLAELNTPLDSRARIQNWSAHVRDQIRISSELSASVALVGDFARGSGGRIAWNSVSPQAGLIVTPPRLSRLVMRGNFARWHAPLAGRYLDYGNSNSLGGVEREWMSGLLLRRFGGPYSAIDSRLRRPYADEFNVEAEVKVPLGIFAALRLFRRDEKNRVATINTGVPAEAYSAVEILDPGPDSLAGTFDDQKLTVYAQDPRTFGQDQYLLTNPPGLRMLNKGLVAEISGHWRSIEMRTSFMAVKSYGPTNPGNTVIENDSGVVGALFQDPNTAIHAAGRTYFDRAYVGKARIVATLPKRFGGIELTNTVDYLDGLAFGRRLLVTGLPQGPFMVAATVRGSPEGGNRAEYVLNWNMRLSRTVRILRGSTRLAVDVLNVINAGNRVQEIDVSGPLFNQRLPVAIQSPRFARFCIDYEF